MKKRTEAKSLNQFDASRRSIIIFLTSCGLAIILLIVLIFVVSASNEKAQSSITTELTSEGSQEVFVTAKDGFYPNVVVAKAGVPLKLKVRTNDTFDCSSVLNIPKLNSRTVLPSTGLTDVNIPAQESGVELTGTCSLGKYFLRIQYQ